MQQLVRMTRSSLIFATIISLTLAIPETRFRKCCPEGMVLSFSSEMACTIPEGDTDQLHIVDPEIADQNEFPICKHQEDISDWKFYSTTLGTIKFLKAPCCIEIMQNRSTNKFSLVTVNSPHSENSSVEESNSVKKSEESLQLLRIKRCCPKDKVFNVLANYCVKNVASSENYSNIHEFFSLLPKLPVHIVKVSNGFDVCNSGALVTYEIAAEDIEYEDESLWVTISEDERHQKIQITFFNGCLELTPNSTSSRKLVLRICRDPDYCQSHSCVRKCCAERHFVSDTFLCNNGYSSSTQSTFYDALSNLTETAWSSTGYGVLFDSNCHITYKLNSSEILSLTKEGYLRENFGLQHPHDSYCLDVFGNGSVLSLVCIPEHKPDTPPIKYVITSSLEVISCVFLLLTLLVYIYLPFLHNLHGKTVMCNAASLLVSYTCLATIPWVTPKLSPCFMAEQCTSKSCAAMGYIMLFSWLSAFSWLNVICFDIWLTFGRLCENRCGGYSQGKRFLVYSLYAWGLPLFITLFCVASDLLTFLPDSITPYIGQFECWFNPNTFAKVIFFQLPVAIQLTSNIGFFILTSKHCNKVKTAIKRMADDSSDTRSSRFHADKDRLIMNIKLFIVMGITWIAEIASSLLNTYSSYQWKEIVFYWSDVINCLQGVLIFIVFVLKPRVYRALKERLRLWRGEHDPKPEQSAKER